MSILDRARLEIGQSLPQIVGALLLLVVGLIAAWIVGMVVGRILRAAGADSLAERIGIHRTLARIGIDRPLSSLLRTITALLIGFIVLVSSLSLLGLSAVDQALNEAILFLPRLLLAFALVIGGIIVGEFAGRSATRLAGQLALELPVGKAVESVVIALAVLTALAQIGVPTQIVTSLIAIAILTVALTGTIAFGLGGRDLAAQVSAGRHVHSAYRIGQQIRIDEYTATIVAFESAATVVQLNDGRTARLPNQKLLNSIVILEPQDTPNDNDNDDVRTA